MPADRGRRREERSESSVFVSLLSVCLFLEKNSVFGVDGTLLSAYGIERFFRRCVSPFCIEHFIGRGIDRGVCLRRRLQIFLGGDLSRSGTSFGIKKHSRAYKPGSVPAAGRQASAIYLRLRSPAVSSDLPPGIGRATLMAPVYMVLQPVRRTAGTCRHFRGGLLPRLFTLTLKIKAVVFCYAAMPLRTSSR